jgi:uncharacterized protein (DUF305 family)
MKKRAFRPDALGILEPRLAPSGQAVQVAAQPAPGVARFEVRWMRGMIAHHGMAVWMAVTNAGEAEIRSMARDIVRAQTREIGDMQRWLAGWYGARGALPSPTAVDRMMLGEMRELRGAEFDRAFLTHMIGHHEAAIADANRLLAGARHPRLLALGHAIIAAQTAEVARMHTMLGHAGAMSGGESDVGHPG